jgi:hypothetical protein
MLTELLSDVRYRLRALFRRGALEQDLDEELRFHIEQEADKYVRAGDSPAEALRRARAAFGGVERIKDDTRDARGLALLDSIAQDLRYAARGLRATPGFTLAVVATLALGLGANAAVFGVLDRLMFRPPPYLRDPPSVHRVYLAATFRGQPFTYHNFEFKRYRDLIDGTHSFDQVAAFTTFPAAVGTGADVTEAVVGTASAGFFGFFEARPALGRFYTRAEDSMPVGSPVAVLDYAYWQTRYGGRSPDLAPASLADQRTLVFCGLLTFAVGLVTGLAPALPAGRGDLVSALKAGAREGSYQRSRLRALLVVVQGALSVALLVGAGLFVRSFANVRGLRLGYDVDPVLYVERNMRGMNLPEDQQAALSHRLRLAAVGLPGVVSATEAVSVPFYNFESRGLFVPGIDSVSRLGRFQLQAGSPDFFRTMGTRILAGRGISVEDRAGSPPIIVVSETMARRLWPGRAAIGQCVRVGADTAPCRTVVGIAEDIRQRSLTESGGASYYLSAEQLDESAYGLFVRVRGRAADASETIRRRLQQEMPGASYVTIIPLAQILGDEQRPWRAGATMFLVLGGLALVVAAIGLYSVIAYSVAQRTQELGVRIALGARLHHVLRIVLGDGLRLALAGIAAGAVLALVAGRWIATLLFAVSPRDPAVFGAVALVLTLTAVFASLIPALRAARVDPNLALRLE